MFEMTRFEENLLKVHQQESRQLIDVDKLDIDLTEIEMGNSLKTSLIDIDKIDLEDNTVPEVNKGKAIAVYKLGGFIKPPVLKYHLKAGKESYTVVRGLEQVAIAKYLQEKDDDFEMVRCYVVMSARQEINAIQLYDMG